MDAMPQTTMKVLQFELLTSRVCINLLHVDKALLLMMLETVPGSAPYLAGLLNLSGNSVPVMDLAMLLGFERSESYALDTPVLLCTHNSQQTGLIIDNIIGITETDISAIQPYQNVNEHSNEMPFSGTISIENDLFLLLNMDYVMSKSGLYTKTAPVVRGNSKSEVMYE